MFPFFLSSLRVLPCLIGVLKTMNNKLKMIGIVFFIVLAVTVSYSKGLFDGRAGKDLSIVAIAEAEKYGEISAAFKGPDEKGNFELVDVRGWKKMDLMELPGKVKLTKLASVNIHAAWVESSPGHWCLVDRRYVWCPY